MNLEQAFDEWESTYQKEDNNPLSPDYTGQDMLEAFMAGYSYCVSTLVRPNTVNLTQEQWDKGTG